MNLSTFSFYDWGSKHIYWPNTSWFPFVLRGGQVKQVMAISDVVVTRNIGSIEITLINSHCFTIRSSRLANRFFLAKNLHLFCFNQFVIICWSLRLLITATRWSPSGTICSVHWWCGARERERGEDQVVMRGEWCIVVLYQPTHILPWALSSSSS